MFFYKDNQTWKFSEDQYLTDEAYHELLDEYFKLPGKYITTDVRDLNRDFYGLKDKSLSPEEEEAKRKRTMIGIILGCVVFASLVVSLILKQILIFCFDSCVNTVLFKLCDNAQTIVLRLLLAEYTHIFRFYALG